MNKEEGRRIDCWCSIRSNFAKSIKTPLLIIHDYNDEEAPSKEAEKK